MLAGGAATPVPSTDPFVSVQEAASALDRGGMVLVVDDADRENEADLVLAAERATREALAFMIRHTSGIVCVPAPAATLDGLALPAMVEANTAPLGTAFSVSVDARRGMTTGISAEDRARTIRTLADPASVPSDFVRPGHVFPLRARDGGVLERAGHTEASLDLLRVAGIQPVAALAELMNDDGSVTRGPALARFAARHRLPVVATADVVAYRRHASAAVRIAEARLPTRFGSFLLRAYASADGTEHVALVHGKVSGRRDVLARIHSECLTGDVFGSARCDCGAQLEAAIRRIADEGRGVLVYLRRHEGRGVGLRDKLRAYELQDRGRDTVDANLELGLPVDARTYEAGAAILHDLGVRSVRLMTNNPAKVHALNRLGLRVTCRIPTLTVPTPENADYLRCKELRLGQLLGVVHPAVS